MSELVKAVGYDVVLHRERGFDLITRFPQESDYLRLLMIPPGKIAYEFKAGKNESVETTSRRLRKKIKGVQNTRVRKLQGIDSGVVVVETNVSDNKKREVFDRFNIRVWDVRTIHFVLSKALLIRRLSLIGKPPKETQLDTVTSVLYATKGRGSNLFFRCYIYYQNPFVMLDSERFRGIMRALTRKLEQFSGELPLKLFAVVTLLSLPGISKDLVDNTKRIMEARSLGKIAYDPHLEPLGFDTASWRFVIGPTMQ